MAILVIKTCTNPNSPIALFTHLSFSSGVLCLFVKHPFENLKDILWIMYPQHLHKRLNAISEFIGPWSPLMNSSNDSQIWAWMRIIWEVLLNANSRAPHRFGFPGFGNLHLKQTLKGILMCLRNETPRFCRLKTPLSVFKKTLSNMNIEKRIRASDSDLDPKSNFSP